MIYTYGITQIGKYHKKIGLPCQDSHKIIKINDSCVIATVADGLGSEKYSDIASSMAVLISSEYCKNNLKETSTDEQILEIIKTSFSNSQKEISKIAYNVGNDISQYDTTLTLAILKNGILYYGHIGDSGLIAICNDGKYEKVTDQQRDEESCVFPLYFEKHWGFGKLNNKICAGFLLATDGILDLFYPAWLRNNENIMYIALVNMFLNSNSLQINTKKENQLKKEISRYLETIPENIINDDKTIVVAIDTNIIISWQPKEYYSEPDQKTLIRKHLEAFNKVAYPSLFSEIKSNSNNKKMHNKLLKHNLINTYEISNSIKKIFTGLNNYIKKQKNKKTNNERE